MKGGGIGIGNKKVSGSAQFVLWGCLLHHGVIAVSTDLELMHKLFPNGGEVTNLEQELGRQIDIKMLARSIAERLARGLGAELEVGSLTQAEASLAHDLLREKYLSEEWNNRRCA
jgi:lipoate-protein ligase A